MVRPVPIVRIDFGNGNVVTRTLHGNIATYLCSADGQVLDILPGIYAPEAYLDSLRQLSLLARFVNQDGPQRRDAKLAEYHRLQADNLRTKKTAARIARLPSMSKASVESSLKLALMPGNVEAKSENDAAKALDSAALRPDDLANWRLLAEDTRINESVRRGQIHEHLA